MARWRALVAAVELEPGTRFPDLDLPDHTGRQRTLSELAVSDPATLITSGAGGARRGPRCMRELCRPPGRFEVAYARIVVVSVDSPEVPSAFRAGLGARFTLPVGRGASLAGPTRAPRGNRHRPRPTAVRVHALPGPHRAPCLQRLLVLGAGDDGGASARHAGITRRVRGDWEVPDGWRRAAVRLRQVRRTTACAGPEGRPPLRVDARCLAASPYGERSRTSVRLGIPMPAFDSTSPRSAGSPGHPGLVDRAPRRGLRVPVDLRPGREPLRGRRDRCAERWPIRRRPLARLFPGTVVEADFSARFRHRRARSSSVTPALRGPGGRSARPSGFTGMADLLQGSCPDDRRTLTAPSVRARGRPGSHQGPGTSPHARPSRGWREGIGSIAEARRDRLHCLIVAEVEHE